MFTRPHVTSLPAENISTLCNGNYHNYRFLFKDSKWKWDFYPKWREDLGRISLSYLQGLSGEWSFPAKVKVIGKDEDGMDVKLKDAVHFFSKLSPDLNIYFRMKDYTSKEDKCKFNVSVTFYPSEGVDFYSFGLIPKDLVPLLERAMDDHISLRHELCSTRDIKRQLWFFTTLGQLLYYFSKTKFKDLNKDICVSMFNLRSELGNVCELGWLDKLLKNVMDTFFANVRLKHMREQLQEKSKGIGILPFPLDGISLRTEAMYQGTKQVQAVKENQDVIGGYHRKKKNEYSLKRELNCFIYSVDQEQTGGSSSRSKPNTSAPFGTK